MNIYQQIVNDLKKQIITEKLPKGSKLPSLSELTQKYNCSKGTVIKAYTTLCSEHIAYSSPKSGYYVADNLSSYVNSEGGFFNLSTGNPPVNNIPTTDIQHCLNAAVSLYGNMSLCLNIKGSSSLINLLKDFLSQSDIYCKSENIYLTQGVLQVLTMLTTMQFPNSNDVILIEEPSYTHFVQFLKVSNVKVKTIKRDEHGINLKELEEIFKNEKIKFFYTIPRNHNPLGTYYTLKQRQKIIELAYKYDTYIVEDDYLSDFCSLSRYSPIYYYSNFERCIYLKSYSKTIPYIRIGAAIIPDSLTDSFATAMRLSYYHSYFMPSLVSQATFESYIISSIYEKHIKYISVELNKMLKAFRKHTKSWDSNLVQIIGGVSGYYTTLKFPEEINCDKLIQALLKRNIKVTSNKISYYDESNFNNSIRISFARLNKEDLKLVLSIIYEEIEKLYYK